MSHRIPEAQPSLKPLQAARVVVFGYGNQARAQAQNLRDSGAPPAIALRAGSASTARATADGFEVIPLEEGARQAEVAALLVPDDVMPGLVAGLAPHWRAGVVFVVAHGFNLAYDRLVLPVSARWVCVAPAGPGDQVRRLFEQGSGVTAFVAFSRPEDAQLREIGLAYAAALGCHRAGLFETTAREETEVDLFGEQAVLCGGLLALLRGAFEALVQAGYSAEMAYLECVQQASLTAQLVRDHGVEGMRDRISPTALYGDLTRGPRLEAAVRPVLEEILSEVRDGQFAREFLEARERGELARLREEGRHAGLEEARKAILPGR